MQDVMTTQAEGRSGRGAIFVLALGLVLWAVFAAAPSFAAVTFRSPASASAASSAITHINAGAAVTRDNCGNITPAIPAGNTDDILIALVVARENSATVTMPGWNQYFTDSYPAQEFQVFIYWRVATGGDPNTITQAGTCDSLAGQIARFRGVDTTNPFETNPILAANWVRQSADNIDTGTETTTSPTAMLLVAGFIMDNGTVTEGVGWSQSFDSSLNINRDTAISLHYQLQTTAGAKTVSNWAASAGADPNYGVIFALRPAATSPLTINKPAGTVTGDVMLASVSVTPSTVTITPPVGWTQIVGSPVIQNNVTSSRLATFYRIAGVGEPASFTWTLTGAHSGAAGGILSFSGVDNATPIDAQANAATASNTTHQAPTVTTTQNGGMLVTIHELTSSRTWTPPCIPPAVAPCAAANSMIEAVDIASLAPSNAAGISMEMNYEVRATAGATGARIASVGGNADFGAAQSVSLKATPLICSTDDFNRANGPPGNNWVVSSSSGGFGNPVIFNNRLRLTDATPSVATMATLQRLFPGSGNRIEVEFDHYAYGGNGADGIAFAFSDSAIAPAPGGYGGSLGYAQRTGINGFAGGWLGVGIDEFGNFSNPTEGRVGGPGPRVDSITVRGSGTGTTGYAYHAGTAANIVPEVDNNGAAVPPHRYRIIVDHQNSVNAFVSVERDTTGGGYTTLVAPYDAKAVVGQAIVPNGWLLSYTGSTGASTNIHEIDSLRICATVQTPISGIHHFEITAAASASTCAPHSVTIRAMDLNNNLLPGYTGSVSITTSSAHGDWGAPATNGTADDGVATYTFVAANNGAITLALSNTHADDLTVNVTDISWAATSTTSSPISFRDSAFVFTPDTIQIAGRNQSISVRLTTSGSCATDTNYTGNKNLDAWLTLDPSDPGGAVPTVNGVVMPTAAPASLPGTNNLANVAFTAGVATLTMATTDVGRYVLNLRDDTRLYANAVDLGGATTSITTRPWLHVAVAGNPGAAGSGPAGTFFTSAGTNFSATIRGVRWQNVDDGNNDGVPTLGADLSDNTVTPSYAWDTTLSPTTPFTPATATDTPAGTGTAGALNNGTVLQASFAGGSANATTLQYTEVGSFTMLATAANYLNSGINVSTAHSVVGRFRPAYFDVTRAHGCLAGAFTYGGVMATIAGQSFSVTATARNALGATTRNYHSTFGFAKDVTISNAGDATGFVSNGLAGASAFTNGVGTTNTINYRFAAKESPPVTLTLRGVDAEGISSSGHTEETTQARSGRLFIQNAFGSELLALPMPMRAQYYFDPNTGFVTNTQDTCTSANVLSLANNVPPSPVSGTAPQTKNIGSVSTTASVANAPLVGGDAGLSFSAPGQGGDGYVDVTVTSPSWLDFDWDGNGTHDNDPTARATFGIYKGSPRHIYLRERY